jgi:hypothetical protein
MVKTTMAATGREKEETVSPSPFAHLIASKALPDQVWNRGYRITPSILFEIALDKTYRSMFHSSANT